MYISLTEGPHDQRCDHPASGEPRAAGGDEGARYAPGERERSMAGLPRAALRDPSFIRACEKVRDDQRTASIRALFCIAQTESVRRWAAQAVAREDGLLRQLSQSVTDVLWIYEPHSGLFLYVSHAYERKWMRSADALYADSRQWFNHVHRDDRPLLRQAFDRLASGIGYAIEYRATIRLGQEQWIAEKAVPIARLAGQALRIAGTSQDITARKIADLQLHGDFAEPCPVALALGG